MSDEVEEFDILQIGDVCIESNESIKRRKKEKKKAGGQNETD